MGKGNKPQKDDKSKMKPKKVKLGKVKQASSGSIFDKDKDGM